MNSYTRQPEEEDLFDRLPDPIVLLIFNKLLDAKSLCLSMSVCKRFLSVIPEIDKVFVTIPRRNAINLLKSTSKKFHDRKISFKNVLSKVLVRPLHFLLQLLKSKSPFCHSDARYSYYMPHQVLNPFKHVESVEIKVPKIGSESALLKWRAEYGSRLKSCVILGAKSISGMNCSHSGDDCIGDSQASELPQERESLIGDDELKLRVVWTISSLTAASTRHYLIQQTLNDLQKLQSLVVTDETNQGKLSMNHQQIHEFKESIDFSSGIGRDDELLSDRTKVPPWRMKMWYVPELKLSRARSVMEGATLVVVSPFNQGKGAEKSGDNWVMEAFDGEGEDEKMFGEAVRKLIKKKRSYTLEMNSF